MPLLTPIANALWTASNLPAYWRFRHALQDPQRAQNLKLQELVRQDVNTAFGKAHTFSSIRNYEDFIQRVPLSDYDALEPWIARIGKGGHKVLTNDTVTHLIPTSGSTGARKLIPFTMSLQREFNAAISAWLVDLSGQFPGLIGGRAYWSITPAFGEKRVEESSVPIGFDTDTAYLGGARKKLAAIIMAAPSNVGRMKSVEEFRYQTLLCLLRCPDLRLISVWHPSFLTLLLDELPQVWDRLLQNSDLFRGLRKADPQRPETIWPNLRVISCWGDGAALLALPQLKNRFPHVPVQPKGLIATEAFVTLPFRQLHPLAVTSHFYEFIDSEGEVLPMEDLREGSEYEVVVTTGGGLWRYRLGDRVSVDGFVARTPSLRFVGRGNILSDRFGEKLSEEFVVKSMGDIFDGNLPSFALLAPDEDKDGCRYTLYVEGCSQPLKGGMIDQALRKNPHYAYCRDLGQLQPPRVFMVSRQGFEVYCNHRAVEGARLGEVKPAALSLKSGWSAIFQGDYVETESRCATHEGRRREGRKMGAETWDRV